MDCMTECVEVGLPVCTPGMVFSSILASARALPDCAFEMLLQFCRENPYSLAASYFLPTIEWEMVEKSLHWGF